MPVIARLDNGKGIVKGDVVPVRRTIGNLRGTYVTAATLTVKDETADADMAAIFQKAITTTSSAAGIIEDDGQTTGVARLLFQLSTTNTGALTAGYEYYYDIQIAYSDGALITEEVGRFSALAEITKTNT